MLLTRDIQQQDPIVPKPLAAPNPSRGREKRAWRRTQTALVAVTLLVAGMIISWLQIGGWIVLGALVMAGALMWQQQTERRHAITMTLAFVTGIAAIDYLTWRLAVTNWAAWWIAVPLVLAEAFGVIHTIGLQVTLWPWNPPALHPTEDPTLHPIFVFIPTVNEGESVLLPTIQAARTARARYLDAFPHGEVHIVICNDGRVAGAPDWQQVELLARRQGVLCVTREVGGGAKAGNIENARKLVGATGDALIVIFDADQIAHPECFIKLVAPLADANVGWVQSGQYYSNVGNPVAKWAHDQQALFYRILCSGKAAQNAAFICGTNVMLRAAALDEIGGLPQDSVTEDFAASIRLHTRWRSIFIDEELASGLGPMDMPSYLKQQRRWAIGTLGVLRTHWREIFLPQRRGLTVAQRFQYFLACTHYLCGLRDAIYIVAPVLFLLTGLPAVRGSTLALFLWHFLPYWVASMAAFWFASRRVTGLRGVIIGFGSFPYLIESLVQVFWQRKHRFTVTAKRRDAQVRWRHLTVHGIAVLVCLVGLAAAYYGPRRQPTSVAISVIWILYTLAMLIGFFWLALRDMWLREFAWPFTRWSRVARRTFAWVKVPSMALAWRSVAVVLVLGTVGGTLLVKNVQASNPPVHFSIGVIQAPSFGLTLPISLLRTQPNVVKNDLHTSLGIIGRTQVIGDDFDTAWAEQLTNQHTTPWVTLQFGEAGPNGRPPLNASLVAISNGVDDNDLLRWADEIRNFGHQVLITVLLHVDRNWAVSSAVANGGIPADSAHAWAHIQAVFHRAGATNVGWVWAPADPAHDQLYAPPLASIDIVLLSMISYPHTQWVNPATAIAAVRHRYTSKPLIIEASAAGGAQQKAQWLTQVGKAVKQNHDIYAFVYHDGSPAINASAADNLSWSLASDPASLAAMRAILNTNQPDRARATIASRSKTFAQPCSLAVCNQEEREGR